MTAGNKDMIDNTLTFILAGGQGSRLAPLTANRSKPSVPYGGKYRIIDFTLANCLHSGLRRILVLTQYKSHSLNKHLRDGWSIFNPELGEYITAVPAQMRHGEQWYRGTADAIFQNLYLLERSTADYVLILSGDHIYRMDYAALLDTHNKSQADATLACMSVDVKEASAFGVVEVDADNRIVNFEEKPTQPKTLTGQPTQSLASMGIYVFSTRLLGEVLTADQQDSHSSHDFGKDILPKLIRAAHVQAHIFGGEEGRVSPDRYWRDVGTIDAFYESNMDLLKPVPPLDLYQNDWPIRTYQPQTPPARTVPSDAGTEGVFINSILSGGVVISGGNVGHSILFDNVFVDSGAIVEQSILFEGVQVGEGARLQNCIIDKHVKIPADEQIGYDLERDEQRFTVSEKGIVVVPSGYRF
jgi:glucose-1-phosphate adenylyltransferase